MQHLSQRIDTAALSDMRVQWDGYTSRVEPWRQALIDGWADSRLTLDELVEKTGLNRGTIHRVLDNKTKDPSFGTVSLLAAAFGPATAARVAASIGETRPDQDSGHADSPSSGFERNRVWDAMLERLDQTTPAEDSVRGDILRAQDALGQAAAALNRALRRNDDPGDAAAPSTNARR